MAIGRIVLVLLVTFSVIGSTPAQQKQGKAGPPVCYSVTDLGEFYDDGGKYLGLNAQGAVVGDTLRWGELLQGFEYKRGSVKQLPTLGGGSADPREINASGQIVGGSTLENGLWHAVLWNHGKPIDLPTLGGGSSFAIGLNDSGDVAGSSTVLSIDDYHAAAWFKGKAVNLSMDGELASYANGINNRGQVAGSTNYPDGTWHAFIWKDGARTELPLPGANVNPAFINNAGFVCGGASFPTGYHAFIYFGGADLVDLDPKSQWWWGYTNGLNDGEHAVGVVGGPPGTHAFLWRNANEGMLDLNSTIPPNSGLTLEAAHSINGREQITARASMPDGTHAVLLTPMVCGTRCAAAPSNMIAWWPGDGNAKDIVSGVNGVTMGAGYAVGAVNKGFTFDGVDDYVDVPNPQSLPEISTAVTVAAWVNPQMPTPPASGGSGEGYVFALRDPLVTEGISLYTTSDGYLAAILQADNWVWFSTWTPEIKYDDSWKHVALAADTTTGRMTLFLNGVAVQDQSIPELTGQFARVQHLFFGQRQRSDTDEGPSMAKHYRGLIDEVQLFNRALAPSEILTIYQAGRKGVCKR
jgi:probable HAF family extracellular repeat protein